MVAEFLNDGWRDLLAVVGVVIALIQLLGAAPTVLKSRRRGRHLWRPSLLSRLLLGPGAVLAAWAGAIVVPAALVAVLSVWSDVPLLRWTATVLATLHVLCVGVIVGIKILFPIWSREEVISEREGVARWAICSALAVALLTSAFVGTNYIAAEDSALVGRFLLRYAEAGLWGGVVLLLHALVVGVEIKQMLRGLHS